jgi:hypothetical protein
MILGSRFRRVHPVAVCFLVVGCDPVCDVVRLELAASDGKAGIPCRIEMQREGENAIVDHEPNARTGTAFLEHTYAASGRYRMAVDCQGYAAQTTPSFEWHLNRMGCGACADLGRIVVVPARPSQ